MMDKKDLHKLSDFRWSIPKEFRPDMNVDAILFASEAILDEILKDRSLEQLINVATLPGIQKAAFAMPDIHEGYGFPIGGVAATLYPEGVISPGGIGYDINCGVRLLLSSLTREDIERHKQDLAHALFREIPSGVGRGGSLRIREKELDLILKEGARRVIQDGYGEESDLRFHESFGCMKNANPDTVSSHAKKRGIDQLGTMGAGNHFVEVDVVEEIFDEAIGSRFHMQKGQIVLFIHTGSRGLGHQVATDYIRLMNQAMPHYQRQLPDRELACVPFSSQEGQDYFQAMCAAANFAFANRQLITHEVRRAWKQVFGSHGGGLSLLYDVTHNMAKIEEHVIDGKKQTLIVHRKGATRSLPPHHPDLIPEYKETGQPVLIPGSMGTASYVLAGAEGGIHDAFHSSCHGAGRLLSRHQAKRKIGGGELLKELEQEGIHIQTGSIRDLAEEAPFAYKSVHEVVQVVHELSIARKVAKLKPLIVIKG